MEDFVQRCYQNVRTKEFHQVAKSLVKDPAITQRFFLLMPSLSSGPEPSITMKNDDNDSESSDDDDETFDLTTEEARMKENKEIRDELVGLKEEKKSDIEELRRALQLYAPQATGDSMDEDMEVTEVKEEEMEDDEEELEELEDMEDDESGSDSDDYSDGEETEDDIEKVRSDLQEDLAFLRGESGHNMESVKNGMAALTTDDMDEDDEDDEDYVPV